MNWLSGSKTPQTGRGTWHIIARKTSVLGAALLLSGCGLLSLAYNQLPNLSYWWLDDYFDFNTAQSTQVRNGLDALALWHKQPGTWQHHTQRQSFTPATFSNLLLTWRSCLVVS